MDKTLVSNEKKLTLLLLCWLFGLLGLHRFYTGKYLTGGLQLLAFGFAGVLMALEVNLPQPIYIPIILLILLPWVIDIVRIIMGKFTDKESKPIINWI